MKTGRVRKAFLPAIGHKRSHGYASDAEKRFATQLQVWTASGEIVWWAYEPLRLLLAKRTSYTPDFVAQKADGEVVIYEVKGFMREDAHVKLKLVADKFPFRVIVVREAKNGFRYEFIEPRGVDDE